MHDRLFANQRQLSDDAIDGFARAIGLDMRAFRRCYDGRAHEKRILAEQKAMVALGEEGVEAHIRTLGLYRNKAKNVVRLSRILIEEYGGEVPSSRAALAALPGVGRKTANVVLNCWWRHPAQADDTHIFRVANRTGIAPGKDVAAVERAIEDNVPAPFQLNAHHWMILHGRYVCKARKPDCPACAIRDLCLFEEKPE